MWNFYKHHIKECVLKQCVKSCYGAVAEKVQPFIGVVTKCFFLCTSFLFNQRFYYYFPSNKALGLNKLHFFRYLLI